MSLIHDWGSPSFSAVTQANCADESGTPLFSYLESKGQLRKALLADDILTVEACMFERITFDPTIMGGRACIRGMRIPVSVIVGQIAHGASFEEILEGYP